MPRRRSREELDEGFALFAADFIMCILCAVLLMALMQQVV
jgi:hypothetical protein